jgi:hypothetical protein
MPKRIILPLLFCLISLLTISNAHAALTFETSSVPYETLETEHFIVRYEEGDDRAAMDVSDALEDSYERITGDIGLALSSKTIVELYTTPKLYNQYGKPAKWAIGGKVYADMNMMAFPSPSTWGEANIHKYEDLRHVMPHEFVHIVLRRYSMPMWLDEGIAVYESGQWGKGYQRLLMEAIEKDELLNLGELEDFKAFIDNGALSYAESSTAVIYIKGAHGDEAFRELLKGIAIGMRFEKALQAATGMGRDEFEEEWRRYLEDMLKPEGQAELPLKTMREARAETAPEEASAKAAPALNANSDDLPSPWLLGVSFAALLFAALLVRALKALIGRTTGSSL